MTDQNVAEVSDVLESFDLSEIKSLVDDQVQAENADIVDNALTDNFRPLHYTYKNILENQDDPDILSDAQDRFMRICDIFLDAIEAKYAIKLDEEWKNNNRNDVPAVVQALYSFFVIDHQSNVVEMLTKYINANVKNLYREFETARNKKDATTLANKKVYSSDYAVVLSNIYDICAYILDNITVDEFMSYIDPDYVPIALMKKLYDDSILVGVSSEDDSEIDFVDRISEIYKNNIDYKGVICFIVAERVRRTAASADDEG